MALLCDIVGGGFNPFMITRLSNIRKIKDQLYNDGPNVVKLLMYDMTGGRARMSLMMQLGGARVEGIWHASVYVFGKEYSFGTKGVKECPPFKDRNLLDYPERIERIGETSTSFAEFEELLEFLSTRLFRGCDYNVLNRNCIIFSQVLCKFLCGESVPKYLLDLPQTVMDKPLVRFLSIITNTEILSDLYLGSETVADRVENVPASQMLSVLRRYYGDN